MDKVLSTGLTQVAVGKSLSVEAFLEKRNTDNPVVDVRSPAEFAKGHIVGAVNMPLFSDEERALVGTLYARNGKENAISRGLEIIGPKLKDFAGQGLSLAGDHEIMIYCWRGGMRSSSMAWLFKTAGLKAFVLNGGYKSYRRYVHEYLSHHFNFVVIGGMTGCGKTEILLELEKLGYPVINLEKLASHKGSVFGAIGESTQPTTEQFENLLFEKISSLDVSKPIFIEDESISIGSVFLPRPFYQRLLECLLVNIKTPWETRVSRLVNQYAFADKEILIGALKKIEKHAGTENTHKAIDHIRKENFRDAVSIILKYYDKVYSRTMKKQHNEKRTIDYELINKCMAENVQQMITFLTQKNFLK